MKKALAIMLVFASLFAFAACAGKENTAATTAATVAQATTAETAETTKIGAVAGKTILLKSNASQDFVEIHTNSDGVATVMKVHKFYADDAAFQAALAAGDNGTYKLEISNEATREIIFSDSETVSGMTYDEITAKMQERSDYTLIPAA